MKKNLIVVIFLTLVGCGIKPKFNEDEMLWLNVYSEGDTLIFKSDANEFDTSIIVAKEIFYPDYNPIELHGTYLPQHGVVWYKNPTLKYHKEGDKLITLIKKAPNEETFLAINFKYSGLFFLDISGENLDKYLEGNQYEFDLSDHKVDSLRPKKIVWDRYKGIVQYVTGDNAVWRRVNY